MTQAAAGVTRTKGIEGVRLRNLPLALVPYLIWVFVATLLQISIWQLNR